MKSIFCIIALLFCSLSVAQKNPKAVYTVPVPEELEAFAEFPIEMAGAYSTGANFISYNLPLKLTGQPAVNVTLYRNAINKNIWEGENFRAACVEEGKFINCELYLLNKNLIAKASLKTYLEKIAVPDDTQFQIMAPEMPTFMLSAIPFSTSANSMVKKIPPNMIKIGDISKQLLVLDHFLSSEPAGILTQRLPGSGNED